MPAAIKPFSDEESRALINLRMRYDAWIDTRRLLDPMPYNLQRKRVSGHDYLYEINDRAGNGKSLGPWSAEKAVVLSEYQQTKARLQNAIQQAQSLLDESGRLSRALRLATLPGSAGELLRMLDRRGLLDGTVLVVGTNCIPAYSLEAAGRIVGVPDETEDFDLAWTAVERSEDAKLWAALKAVDPTFAVNTEKQFQARNAKALEVELLVAPSRVNTMAGREKPRPLPLPEQEWLLLGRPVDQVVPCRDGTPARIVAPDPRWFALQKLWMARQDKRNPLKRPKDRKQGLALLNAVDEAMPHYRLDAEFAAQIPDELQPMWREWQDQRPAITPPDW